MSKNLYKRGDSWYARIKVEGIDYRQSLRTGSKREAERRLEKWRKDIEKVKWGDDRYTWKEAVIKFLTEGTEGLSDGTTERYRYSLKHAGEYYDELYLDQISRRELAALASRPDVSNATRRRDLTAVSAVLRCCVGWGWLEDNPVRSFDRHIIKERRSPIIPPRPEDITKLVNFLPGNFARCIRFLSQTGMRQNEAFSLEWDQVDFKRMEVTLLKTKTNKPRVVPLTRHAGGTLRGTGRHNKSLLVFWHGVGKPYLNIASRFLGRVKKLAEIDKGFRPFRCHDLRHYHAIEYLKEHGRNALPTLSQNLGHSSIKTTETFYLGYVR